MFDKTFLRKIKKGEAYLILNPANCRYLSNFACEVSTLFLTKDKAHLLVDARYAEEARRRTGRGFRVVEIKESLAEEAAKLAAKLKIKKIFFESGYLTYEKYLKFRPAFKKISFVPQTGFVESFRQIKTAHEIALIVKAQRIAEKVLHKVTKNLKAGQTEKEVAWRIEKLGHELGADSVSFAPIVCFGKTSSVPHHRSGSRKLKKGDVILIDSGFKCGGYCSDMTRVFFTARPTPLQEKIYNLVLKAQEEAIKSVKAGADSCKIDAVARNIIGKAGYRKNFLHSLGHGVGLEIHELPHLNNRICNKIPDGAVITVEPGIYLQNSFGVRIEDMVLVKGNLAVNLTRYNKEIAKNIIKIH